MFHTIIGYDEAIRPVLLETLTRLDLTQIAISTSADDVYADGLIHGMYQLLTGYLAGTPYAGRLVSAEKVIAALRAQDAGRSGAHQ